MGADLHTLRFCVRNVKQLALLRTGDAWERRVGGVAGADFISAQGTTTFDRDPSMQRRRGVKVSPIARWSQDDVESASALHALLTERGLA